MSTKTMTTGTMAGRLNQRSFPLRKTVRPIIVQNPVNPSNPAKTKKEIKKAIKKKMMNSGEYLRTIANDIAKSYAKIVNDSTVMIFVILACVLVFTHPSGIHSGPIGKLLKKYPDHPFLNFVEDQFAKLLALTIFVPVWFAVPSDGLIVSIIASVFWVLISEATIMANFILSTLLFTFLSVKLFRTKLFLLFIGSIIYLIVYSGASVKVTMDSKPLTYSPAWNPTLRSEPPVELLKKEEEKEKPAESADSAESRASITRVSPPPPLVARPATVPPVVNPQPASRPPVANQPAPRVPNVDRRLG